MCQPWFSVLRTLHNKTILAQNELLLKMTERVKRAVNACLPSVNFSPPSWLPPLYKSHSDCYHSPLYLFIQLPLGSSRVSSPQSSQRVALQLLSHILLKLCFKRSDGFPTYIYNGHYEQNVNLHPHLTRLHYSLTSYPVTFPGVDRKTGHTRGSSSCQELESISPPLESRVGCETGFDQYNVAEATCHVNKHEITSWRIRDQCGPEISHPLEISKRSISTQCPGSC